MQGEKNQGMSRRSFIMAGAAAMIAGAAGSLAGCADGKAGANSSSSVEWTGETDVVIVGAGAAGLSAAVTAKTEFPDVDIMLVDAAPMQEIGGNSRVCGQVLHYLDDVDAAVTYLTACNGNYEVEPEYVKAWAEGIIENYDWLTGLGCNLEENTLGGAEFPEYDGADHVHQMAFDGTIDTYDTYGDGVVCGTLYGFIWDKATELGVECKVDTRVTDFVLDEATHEIRGVVTESGESYKARKGVILACGGFENDLETLRGYLPIGYDTMYPFGTPYNRGDGLKMAQSVGAQLWHMNNFAGNGIRGVVNDDVTYGTGLNVTTHDFVFIGPKGKRFMFEERFDFQRHGRIDLLGGGVYQMSPMFQPAWMVFGQNHFDTDNPVARKDTANDLVTEISLPDNTNEGGLEAGIIVKADTLEELAQKIELEEFTENLVETMTKYNKYADKNFDLDYKRGQYFYDAGIPRHQEIPAFDLERIDPPYYALRLTCRFLNTQGGPKRNEKSEVLDLNGNSIPRLYSAGELGAIYSNDYNGGGNMAECFRTGREAMRNIANIESWEA